MKDPTADSALAYINKIAVEREKNLEIDALLDSFKDYMAAQGYTIHGKVSVIDKRGKARSRYL